MNVEIMYELPDEWKNAKPIRRYDTRFIFLGIRRYDTERKVISGFIVKPGGAIVYEEYEQRPDEATTLSRSYGVDHATVTIYSESPRVWVEELSSQERFVFVQQDTQVS